MQVIAEINPLREHILSWRRDGQRIAFIPTMGHLHEGHLTLVRKAREIADVVLVSIFVNPTQFDKADDLNNYPRTLEDDIAKLHTEGVEIIFTPSTELMYPNGVEQITTIDVPNLSNILEGLSRPGHFKGVATIVTKLFNMVQPDVALFGEKDFQQLAIIKKMTADLSLPIEIISVPTVREMDGLAMSSRNSRLTVDERQRAPVLHKTLRWLSSQIRGGRSDQAELIQDANDQLRAAGLEPDEIFIRDANTLQPVNDQSQHLIILASVFLGAVRLIDNVIIDISNTISDDSEE